MAAPHEGQSLMSTRVHILVEGNLVAEPVFGESANGTKFAKFTVAVTERKLQDGAWANGDTEFHRTTAFGRTAENVRDSLAKGDAVIVTGALDFRHWTDAASGEHRTATEIVADAVAPSLRFVPAKSVRQPRPVVDPAAAPVTNWQVRVPGTDRMAASLS
jgi:single-strand DNA-binding protein